MSTKITEKYLIKKIQLLKNSATRHRSNNKPGQRRYWMYPYLQDVYEVFRDIQSQGIAKKAGRRIVKLLRLPIKKKSHVIRVLIEASAGAEDNRTKIKWANALKYAFGWLQEPARLEWFFGVNGGLAGCTAKYADLKKARHHKRVQKQASSSAASNAQSAVQVRSAANTVRSAASSVRRSALSSTRAVLRSISTALSFMRTALSLSFSPVST